MRFIWNKKLNKVAIWVLQAISEAKVASARNEIWLKRTQRLMEKQTSYESLCWAIRHLDPQEMQIFSQLAGVSIKQLQQSLAVLNIARIDTYTQAEVVTLWNDNSQALDELTKCDSCNKLVYALSKIPLRHADGALYFDRICRDCALDYWQSVELDQLGNLNY